MYCGEVDISRSDLPQFLQIADHLQIRGLADKNQETINEVQGLNDNETIN